MNNTGKYLLLGAGALLVFSVASSAAKARRTAGALEVRMLPTKDRADLEKVRVLLDAEIKNPSTGTLVLSDPLVIVSRGGREMKRIDLSGHRIKIMPESVSRLSDPAAAGGLGGRIVLEMPTPEIIALFPEIVAALAGSGPAFMLDIKVSMGVKAPDLPLFRHTETMSFTIQRPF